MNKLVSRNPVLRFRIQYYLGGTSKNGINLGIKSKEEIESNNNRERNLASHHFSKVFSNNEGIWDGIKHLARGILHGYNGYLDPETLYQTGSPTILPGRTPTKVPSVRKVGTMLKNKLFLRGYNKSGVRISSVPIKQVPEGERITFFKNADGSRTPRYYDKKYGHWIDVEMQTPKTTSNVAKVVKVEPYPDSDVSIVRNYSTPEYNLPLYNYDDDVMMLNSAAALDDAIYNYDPGIIDIFKTGGQLVSKNLVLRFKEGRKILFAQNGTYFPVVVKGRTFLYNPYTRNYKGTQASGQNLSYLDIVNAFNKLYESVKHAGNSVYRKRGSHTTWTNLNGKQVNLAPKKTTTTNSSDSVNLGSTTAKRFSVSSTVDKNTRYFDTKEEAKAYLRNLKPGTTVWRDAVQEASGSPLKVDRTKEKATEWGRLQLEKNNNLSFKLAYQEGRKSGNKYFAWRGKVYKTDLENGKDNITEMAQHYGNHYGYTGDPKLLTNSSRAAREQYRKDIDAKQGNRRASYQGKTNKQASAEADEKVAQTWGPDHQVAFWDALMPITAIGNGVNAVVSGITGEKFVPRIYASGFNPLGYAHSLTRAFDGDVASGLSEGLVRGIDAYTTLGMPGVSGLVDRTMTRFAPRLTPISNTSKYIPEGGLENGTLNKWNWNSLARGGARNTQSSWNKGVKVVTEGGRRSMQRAANEGFLFTGFLGADKAAQLATNFGLNPNTGTTFFFRGTPTTYDVAADRAVLVAPWLGVPANVNTLQLYNNL